MSDFAVNELFRRYVEMQEYCKSPDFDSGVFHIKMDAFNSLYKRSSYFVQGEYHHRISELK